MKPYDRNLELYSNRVFDFNVCYIADKSNRRSMELKLNAKEIPDYETFALLSQAYTNNNRDDLSRVRFMSSLTEYAAFHLRVKNQALPANVRKEWQKYIDYVDGKTDEMPVMWTYEERETPKDIYLSYDIHWQNWFENQPNIQNFFVYLRKNINKLIDEAEKDGVVLYGGVSKMKFYRIKKGFSQEELASRIGVKRSRISKIETGEILLENCTAKTVQAIAQQLDVSMEELLDNKLYYS